MMKYNKSTVVSIWDVVVSCFCGKPTSKRWLLKIVQLTMQHDPFGVM